MQYAEHRLKAADGLGLYARDYAAQGTACGVPVLCLPGLTRNSADFESLAPAIAALGRRVIALDFRGRGLSDKDSDPNNYRPNVYSADALGVLDALAIPRAVFIGTSLGGIVTMLTAVLARERIAAAVLNDIGPELDPAGLARIAAYVGKSEPFASWDETVSAVRTAQSAAFPGKDDAFWRIFAKRVARALPDGRVAFAYDPAIAQTFAPAVPPPNMLPLFEALSAVPVLLVRGALSDLLLPEGAATMRRMKPDLDFALVPDVGHAPTLEEPQARAAIADFLARVP
jgi:pimeloyl-ACP methyl ester carboxylesterase